MKEENMEKESNVYLKLIEECRNEASRIREAVNFIHSNSVLKDQAETPFRTTLENDLKELLRQLKDISSGL